MKPVVPALYLALIITTGCAVTTGIQIDSATRAHNAASCLVLITLGRNGLRNMFVWLGSQANASSRRPSTPDRAFYRTQ
jgi:hypothetical protein